MSIPEPILDDLRFQKDLVDEARRRIVRYSPDWTDYNVSDPGITLIELFAWSAQPGSGKELRALSRLAGRAVAPGSKRDDRGDLPPGGAIPRERRGPQHLHDRAARIRNLRAPGRE